MYNLKPSISDFIVWTLNNKTVSKITTPSPMEPSTTNTNDNTTQGSTDSTAIAINSVSEPVENEHFVISNVNMPRFFYFDIVTPSTSTDSIDQEEVDEAQMTTDTAVQSPRPQWYDRPATSSHMTLEEMMSALPLFQARQEAFRRQTIIECDLRPKYDNSEPRPAVDREYTWWEVREIIYAAHYAARNIERPLTTTFSAAWRKEFAKRLEETGFSADLLYIPAFRHYSSAIHHLHFVQRDEETDRWTGSLKVGLESQVDFARTWEGHSDTSALSDTDDDYDEMPMLVDGSPATSNSAISVGPPMLIELDQDQPTVYTIGTTPPSLSTTDR